MVEGNEIRSLLRPFLLLLLCERPGHGYELIERLGELGVPGVEPGHAYRVLRDLERARLLRSAWEPSGAGPARRRYELTPEGRGDLEGWVPRLAAFSRVLGSCVERWAEISRSEVPRAEVSRAGGLAGGGR